MLFRVGLSVPRGPAAHRFEALADVTAPDVKLRVARKLSDGLLAKLHET